MVADTTAIDRWLGELGLEHLTHQIACEGDLTDFLVLPFLQPSLLSHIGISSPSDTSSLLSAISALHSLSPSHRTSPPSPSPLSPLSPFCLCSQI